jgi:Subtilase family
MRRTSALGALAAALFATGANAAASTRVVVLLRTPSLAQRVASHGGAATIRQERAWTRDALAAQRAVLGRLAARGILVRPALRFARVVDGFSAVIPATVVPVVERDPGVAGVYPVRPAEAASVSVSTRAMPSAAIGNPLASAGIDGRGVAVAVVDTAGADGRETAAIVSRVAPGASVVPVRLAMASSDEIVAGLERAVDPNGDGDAHDAARVALVAPAEPFAGFADSPEARAVAGARALDMLVVAPAGNDGHAGPAFGDIAGPGAAPAALTVGALDTVAGIAETRVVVRSGLHTLFDGARRVAGAVPARRLELRVVAPPSLFTQQGGSTVAGLAALAVGRFSGQQAADAGASAVLGETVDAAAVPVLSLPPSVTRTIRARLAAGAEVTVTLGPAYAVANRRVGRVASFSSTGLSYDGGVKPDVVAPGVGIPGGGDVRVSGSSAAAAVAAGSVALLAQARPGLDARELAGLLVATSRSLAGKLDVDAAAAGEIASSPGRLANVSDRVVHLMLGTRNVVLRPGGSVSTGGGAHARVVGGGTLRILPAPVRVPPVDLLGGASVSPDGSTLTVSAGRVLHVRGGVEIRPVARLDVVLDGAGLLARVRDALPGTYTFALTGRGAGGAPLAPGEHVITVLAYPVGGGAPSRRSVGFSRR